MKKWLIVLGFLFHPLLSIGEVSVYAPQLHVFIHPEILRYVISQHISEEYWAAASEKYESLMWQDGSVTNNDLNEVCRAGHLENNECQDFKHALLTGSAFYQVCGKDQGIAGAHCIDKFFVNNGGLNNLDNTRVRLSEALGLAKEYALVQDNNDVICSTSVRTEKNDDFIRCKTVDGQQLYEFRFDAVNETNDTNIRKTLHNAVCKLHASGYKDFVVDTNYANLNPSGMGGQAELCTTTDERNCTAINKSLQRFAHSAKISSYIQPRRGPVEPVTISGCFITSAIASESELRTAYGIDPTVFRTQQDILGSDLENRIKRYVEAHLQSRGQKLESFSCASSTIQMDIPSESRVDDILTCYVNGSPVDFLFDDLFETKTTNKKAASQAMECIISGGTFNGKECMGLNEQQCDTVRNTNATQCPECSLIKWNPEKNMCELPSAARAENLRRGINYTAIVGGAILSVVITVGSLGTATAPTAVVLTGLAIELAGAGIELRSQALIYMKTDEFFKQANSCDNEVCAQIIIKEYLQSLSNQANDLGDNELLAADSAFARLFNLIPADSQFYTDIVQMGIKGMTLESNTLSFWDANSWNSEQIWRAVGIGLQILPTIASVTWRVAKKSDKLMKATATLRSKIDDASKHIDDVLHINKMTGQSLVDISDLRHRLSLDDKISAIKNGDTPEFYIMKSTVSDAETRLLSEELSKEGLELSKADFSDEFLRVRKLGSSDDAARALQGITKLDAAQTEILNRLDDLTDTTWEYKAATNTGTPGQYRINYTKLTSNSDQGYAIENKLRQANVRYSFQSDGKYQYLIISEENIGDVGKIKPISVVMDEVSKTGSDFIGNLKGWKVENMTQVTDKYRNSVFKFTEANSGKTYYLKHVPDMDEINRTKRAYEVLEGRSSIVHSVKVIEDNQDVLIDFAAKNNLLKSSGEYWVLIDEVPTSKMAPSLLSDNTALKTVLGGKPITVAEQKEITRAVENLNSAGIIHGDLEHNMFFVREPTGKLRVDIIDYEVIDGWSNAFVQDKTWLRNTFDKFSKAGLAEPGL